MLYFLLREVLPDVGLHPLRAAVFLQIAGRRGLPKPNVNMGQVGQESNLQPAVLELSARSLKASVAI
jgi:hypothetical protein